MRTSSGNRDQASDFLNRAGRCLDLDAEPPAIRPVLGMYAALYLKETLDRIDFPPLEDIPDAKAVEARKLTAWILPFTEITIAAGKDGPAGGKFLFSPDTVNRSEEFYDKVRLFPYKPGAEGALFDQLSSSAGPFGTKEVIDRLPQWAKAEICGQALWQWIGLILYIVATVGAVALSYRCALKALRILDTKLDSSIEHSIGGLVLPTIMILFPESGLRFLVYCLHLRNAEMYLAIAFVCLLISYAGRIWLYAAILNRAAEFVISLGRIERSGTSAQLIRFGFDVATVVVVIASAINLGARLGLPTYSLVTGLGVGGLAVALAGKETLSNLFGTVAILLDRPFKLGDLIVLGEGERGTSHRHRSPQHSY